LKFITVPNILKFALQALKRWTYIDMKVTPAEMIRLSELLLREEAENIYKVIPWKAEEVYYHVFQRAGSI